MADTPFLKFWAALNEQLRDNGYPELTFGPAHSAWQVAVEDAQRESMRHAMKVAA